MSKPSIQHFTDLQVWQKSHRLFLDVLGDIDQFSRRRAADILAEQSIRSAASISANIAEGFNRSTKKFLNCLDIALGEVNETENWLLKIRDARFLSGQVCALRIEQTQEVGRMLNGLIKSLQQYK